MTLIGTAIQRAKTASSATVRARMSNISNTAKKATEVAKTKNSRYAYCDRCLYQTSRWMRPSMRLADAIAVHATSIQVILRSAGQAQSADAAMIAQRRAGRCERVLAYSGNASIRLWVAR